MASWAEQYQARKAERLKEEKSKLNKKLGFGLTESCSEEKVDVKDIKVTGNGVTKDEDSDDDKQEKVDKPATQNENKSNTACTDTDCVDPWYSTYEAKKAAALENLKSGKLQSVSGASGFVGKIEGVENLSKKNEVTKLINKFKKEDSREGIADNVADQKREFDDMKTNKVLSVPVLSSGPPPPPRQLLQLSMPGEPSSPPADRPARPSVPTPGKYGTHYGGAPSPGPNPSKSFHPPGFVPPTPPASLARRRPWSERKEDGSMKSMMRTVKEDSKLSTSSWQEEYLARKKARMEKN